MDLGCTDPGSYRQELLLITLKINGVTMKGLEGHFHVKFSREISLENGPPELSYIIEVDPLDSNMHSHCDESLYV